MKKLLIAVMTVAGLLSAAGLPSAFASGDVPPAADNAKTKPVVADLAEAQRAQRALDELIRAYETGNVGLFRERLDPSMIGYQRFLDGVVQDTNRLKQIRINLSDVQVMAGPDVAVIQANWEKRFLSANGLAPDLNSGHSMFLLHRDQDQWRVAAFGGDNLFASQSGVLGQIFLTVSGSTLGMEIVDPDMAGTGRITVTVITSGGQAPRTLTESLPGRFQGETSVPTGLVTVKYLDNNPGGGRPPSWVSRSMFVQ